MKLSRTTTALGAAIAFALALPAQADITVGITVSATGPAASLGIPQKNTLELLPATIGGEKVKWVLLDDASEYEMDAAGEAIDITALEEGRLDDFYASLEKSDEILAPMSKIVKRLRSRIRSIDRSGVTSR